MNRILMSTLMTLMLGAMSFAASTNPPAIPELKMPPAARPTQVATPQPALPAPATPRPAPTQAATAKPDPAPPTVRITLERVTAVRSRRFGNNQTTGNEMWDPRLVYQFRVAIPQGWNLMSIDDGRVKRIEDRRGQLIRPKTAIGPNGQTGAPGQAIALELKPEYGIIEFTSELPQRQDDKLGKFSAAFSLTVGQSQTLRFEKIRSKSGNMLPGKDYPDVVLAVDEVGEDSISIAAFGDTAKFGAFTFTGPGGEKFEPITAERTMSEAVPGHPAGILWHFGFAKLTKPITMDVQYYPFRRRAIYNYEESNIPLP